MNLTNEEKEKNLALTWHEGKYTDEQAERSCNVQGLNWVNVTLFRSYLYEEEQRAGAMQWN